MTNHPTIGLEVHVELKTQTKMFCRSINDPEAAEPNINICPVCLGHPGTLPTINQAAVSHVLRVGLAVGGQLADFTEFDRKNYFYPDIPKGYQISQHQYPLVTGGRLAGVDITRVHLEEDTARLQHDPKTKVGLVDFNRAGVPLMELVTEPVITSANQAVVFARELKLLLSPEYLNVSGANLEKGEMRIEANVSWDLGDKVEIKNLNSFRSVERAIDYELSRQKQLLVQGKKVLRETRGFDDNRQITFSQRQKEESHDYRYFPDPDLPKMYISAWPNRSTLAQTLPEVPWVKRDRFKQEFGLKPDDIEILIQTQNRAAFFEQTAKLLPNAKSRQVAANILVTEVWGRQVKLAGQIQAQAIGQLTPESLVELVILYQEQKISSRGVKDLIPILITEGGQPAAVAEAHQLLQQSNQAALKTLVSQVINDNPEAVKEYLNGKTTALQFLVGQGMKLSKGSANPQLLAKLLTDQLG